MTDGLLLAVSGHGRGHLAQMAPVANALLRLTPGRTVTVRSALSRPTLARRFDFAFDTLPAAEDFGLRMRDAYVVDRDATERDYEASSALFETQVAALVAEIKARRIGAVVANASFLPLLAARRAGIASIGFSSINWLDVLRAYGLGSVRVLDGIETCYASATAFFHLAPGLPSPSIVHRLFDRSIASIGHDHGNELRRNSARPPGTPVILFSFDNSVPPPPAVRAGRSGALFVGPDAWHGLPGCIGVGAAGLSFLDLIASANLVIGKPGYGIVTEATAARKPLLLLGRNDWPETATLVAWLHRHGRGRHLDLPMEFLADAFLSEIRQELMMEPAVAAPCFQDGAADLAALIMTACGER